MRYAALSILLMILLQLAPVDPPAQIERQPRTVALREGRQLFVDDQLIDRMESVFRSVGAPTKDGANPIFKPEMPWEGRRILYSDVLFDSGENLYKLWYSVYDERSQTAGLC